MLAMLAGLRSGIGLKCHLLSHLDQDDARIVDHLRQPGDTSNPRQTASGGPVNLSPLIAEDLAQGTLPTIGVKYWARWMAIRLPTRNDGNRAQGAFTRISRHELLANCWPFVWKLSFSAQRGGT